MTGPAYRYCPACGGALAERVIKAGDPMRLVCAACEFVFYLDPKIAVGAIVRAPSPALATSEDDRILLLRRAIEPGYGKWVFPGGYVDRGEHLHTAALREAREECGLDIRLTGLVNIYSYAGRTPIIVVYAASCVSGEVRLDDESLEARWYAPAEIPWDELAFRSTREALREYLDGRLYPLGAPLLPV